MDSSELEDVCAPPVRASLRVDRLLLFELTTQTRSGQSTQRAINGGEQEHNGGSHERNGRKQQRDGGGRSLPPRQEKARAFVTDLAADSGQAPRSPAKKKHNQPSKAGSVKGGHGRGQQISSWAKRRRCYLTHGGYLHEPCRCEQDPKLAATRLPRYGVKLRPGITHHRSGRWVAPVKGRHQRHAGARRAPCATLARILS